MSAISNVLDEVLFSAALANVRNVSAARAELARLRADLQAAQERIAAQARQLDAARSLIDEITDDYIVSIDKDGLSYVSTNIIIDMIDWLTADSTVNRIACAVQLYDDWHGYYVVQHIVDGTYVDVRQLSRDEAMTYRIANNEALKVVWKQ